MIELKERSEKTIRKEVFDFGGEFGAWNASTWTRLTVNGKLDCWIPHDGYGEMMQPGGKKISQKLEQIYQESDYVQ